MYFQLLSTTLIIILKFFEFTQCQLNGVKPELVSCYNTSALPGIIIAENRPPATLNIFLEILRRIEDANPDITVRDLSILLVQRLKQNGIAATGRAVDYSIAIPFAPTEQEAIKGTFVANEFLPNSQLTLKYGNIDMSDICAFHYMISNTVNTTVRGDESQTCIRSSRYQMRIRREIGEREDVDSEMVEKTLLRQSIYPTAAEMSECPIELGVIYTNHGTIKAGQVLQGLAAGLNKEKKEADNRYVATLTSDLAHVGLIQMQPPLIIGAQGGWNSTINPKYFFLQKNDDIELSDQDIRGSLDGLLLGLKIDDIKKTFVDIKLSQIIDMYYSPSQKGIFDSSFRACNRNILYSELVTSETLGEEIYNVLLPLDRFGPYPGSVTPLGYETLKEAALNNFTSYLPQIVDLACPQINSDVERVSTDILIFIDGSYKYVTIQPIVSYILDNIDVNKFGSRYTIFSGSNGVNITNSSSRFLLDFHKQYNLTIHENITGDFDYAEVYKVIESTVKSKLNNKSYTGGESTIALLIPGTKPSDAQNLLMLQRKEIIRQFLPDLSIILLGSGSSEDYSSLLVNPSKDFIALSDSTNENDLKNTAQNVIDAIRMIPRSIVNPSCGASLSGSDATFSLTDYVDLYGINFYKIAPNYFYKGDANRHLKIIADSTGSITVCLSRDESRPTNQTGDCVSLKSSVKDYDITNWCEDSSLQECSPIYFSVYGNTSQIQCNDMRCRFPNNIKYSIKLENVGCASSAIALYSNLTIIFILLVLKIHV
ncbi:uncharacterized protein LOC130901377 [Diorhabda carinulata]|uniref:uncharacterized protein LOC130901377 n=1 Tax=Diorhabda carinulata TaxID=1163345 RepID=UPI0025A241BB|nr:uncharacterized protein LOC130901377 [Diorhabda carinulata]